MKNNLEKIKGLVETLTKGSDDFTATKNLRKPVRDVHDFHPDVTDDELHQILIPAIRSLVNMLENAKVAPHGVYKLPEDVNQAVMTLEVIGDSSAIPTLEKLRERLKGAGIESEYVVTSIAAGWTSTRDEICAINDTIREIEGRVAKRQKEQPATQRQTEPTAKPKTWWGFRK